MRFELTLSHRFPDRQVTLSVTGSAGVTALFGPSGAGKTTAIRAMAGLLAPDEGRISLGDRVLFDRASGVNLAPSKRRLGYVFQDGRLFPHLSVLENMRFGARYASMPAPLSEDLLVDLLGLGGLLDRMPRSLSGGEIQRVALARALLSVPDMLLMDEPLAALDGPRKEEILPYLDRLKTEAKLPILYVTHSVEEIARLADHVVVMSEGQSVLQGPVFDVLSDPKAMPFLGVREAGAILMAKVEAHETDGLTRLITEAGPLFLPGVEAKPGENLRLRILARDVILATERPSGLSARNILPARVQNVQTGRGPGAAVVLNLGSQTLLARVTDRAVTDLGLVPGKPVYAILKATAVARSAITT